MSSHHGNQQPAREQALVAQQAYSAAIRMLARRDHSFAELRQKLERKFARDLRVNSEESALDEVMVRIQEHGYLDDQRFAESYARSRVGRGYGPQYIQRDLAQKGINSDAIETALAPFSEEWDQIARDLVERRYAGACTEHAVWQKAARFLQRRGFSSSTVMRALGDRPRHD